MNMLTLNQIALQGSPEIACSVHDYHDCTGCVSSAAYSQSKSFIALFGFHLCFPAYTFCILFAVSHSYAATSTFTAIQGVILQTNLPERAKVLFHSPRLHHLQLNTQVHAIFILNKTQHIQTYTAVS